MLISQEDIIIRLLVALLIGSILGFERSKAHKPAGMRTHALVCIAATTISMVSAYGFTEFMHDNQAIAMDPARLIVGIITGIGFLGAGIIIKDTDTDKGSIRGLTTAANVWAAAGLGIAIGLGHFFISFVTVGIMLAALHLSRLMVKLGVLEHDE